jgi:translocation and assembly module TamB
MKRRHLVVIVSAFTLLTVLFVAAVMIGVGVATDPGREQIRSLIERQLAGNVRGKVHLGRIRGGGLTGFTLDSFAIRDLEDSLLVSSGRVIVQYDVRDLMDRRLLLRNVQVENPVIRLRQYEKGDWNFQRVFRRGRPSGPDAPGTSFGDFVVLDSVRVRHGEFILTRPWSPDDSLRGANRDSAILRNLTNPEREIRRNTDGLTHTYRWSRVSGFLPHARIANPDSNRFGMLFVIDTLNVDEFEPPFKFRNGRGVVRKLGDSVFVDIAHFQLPASAGSAKGRIWWGSGLPIRVDVNIKADSVSLNDVAWVYETLPRSGGGKTNLRITNNRQNLKHFEYALSDMDVTSTRSRVMGAMTFVVGGPVLVVKDVDLRGAPVNFDLVRTFAGEPLPVDWQGNLYGIVRGPGGPLTHFVVDSSHVTFRDAHVVGAISQGSGRGGLNILDPELTEFHNFQVNVGNLDLRSIQHLFPAFPRIGGTISGVAALDSSWLDVRFSRADITHRNMPGEPSRLTGAGRVTYGEQFLTYDVTLNAQPLSLTMMSRAYELGLKGLMSGPITAKGTTNDLQLTMQLQGPAGAFTYAGRVDLYPLSVAARGTGRLDQLDLAQVLDRPTAPLGFVTGSYQIDVRGDTNDIGTLVGAASLLVERSELDGVRIYPSRLRARFADRRLLVDTLIVESVAAKMIATGALGLTNDRIDSLWYEVSVDSLGGVRRYVTPLLPARGSAEADSLAGSVTLQGYAKGSLRTLGIAGTVTGTNVVVRREAGRAIQGTFAFSNLLDAPTGGLSVRFNSLDFGGIRLDSVGTEVQLGTGRKGTFTFGAVARNGVRFSAAGNFGLADKRSDLQIRTLEVLTAGSRWSLGRPATLAFSGDKAFTVDSLVLANNRGGRVAVTGNVPDSGAASIVMRADSLPLHDIGEIIQLRSPLDGVAHLTLVGAGTAAAPTMNLQARLNRVQYGNVQAERVNASAEYSNHRARVALDLIAGGRTALLARGSLPVDVRYFGAELLEDTLVASVRTDSASFSLIRTIIPALDSAKGELVANLDVRGTWKHPDITGALRVENGEAWVDTLGIRLRGVNVDIGFFGHGDSLAIRRAVAWSGTTPGDSISLSGYVAYRDLDNPYVDLRLRARNFHSLDKRALARLNVSTQGSGMRLRGQLRGATLTGAIVVDRGVIFLPDPELARKRYGDFTSMLRDTARTEGSGAVTQSRLFESIVFDDVRLILGEEVRLQSREANIVLGGELDILQQGKRRSVIGLGGALESDSSRVPVFDGVLRAERGTYTLAFGPLVRREFDVEGGTVTFFGAADLAPELDIRALHTVRTLEGGERKIRVRLTGTPANPVLGLESAESYVMSQSDMVSYLLFGQPSFALGQQNAQAAQIAAQNIFPGLTDLAAEQLRGYLGPAADFLQLRPGSSDLSEFGTKDFSANTLSDIFYTSRVGGEKQITQNLFISMSTGTGWCPGQSGGERAWSQEVWVEGLSGKLEYRMSGNSSLRVGKEPGTSTCRVAAGRVVPAPSQWGLSLFKTWRF